MILRKKVSSPYFDVLAYLDNQNTAGQPLLVDNMQHCQYVMASAISVTLGLLNTNPMKDQIRGGIYRRPNRLEPLYESKCVEASQNVSLT